MAKPPKPPPPPPPGGGDIVWPGGNHAGPLHFIATEGVPAVYSVGGKQYVAIAVGGNGLFSQGLDQSEPGPGHYLVFALGGSNQ